MQEGSSQDVKTLYRARVDLRKFSKFLQGQFNPTKVICSEYNSMILIVYRARPSSIHVRNISMEEAGSSLMDKTQCGDSVVMKETLQIS